MTSASASGASKLAMTPLPKAFSAVYPRLGDKPHTCKPFSNQHHFGSSLFMTTWQWIRRFYMERYLRDSRHHGTRLASY